MNGFLQGSLQLQIGAGHRHEERLHGLAENIRPIGVAGCLDHGCIFTVIGRDLAPTHHLAEEPEGLALPGEIGSLGAGDEKLLKTLHVLERGGNIARQCRQQIFAIFIEILRGGQNAGEFLDIRRIRTPFAGTVQRAQQGFQNSSVVFRPWRFHRQYLFGGVVPDQRPRRNNAAVPPQHHGAACRLCRAESIDLAAFQQSRHGLGQGFNDFHIAAEQHAIAAKQISKSVKRRRNNVFDGKNRGLSTLRAARRTDAGHGSSEGAGIGQLQPLTIQLVVKIMGNGRCRSAKGERENADDIGRQIIEASGGADGHRCGKVGNMDVVAAECRQHSGGGGLSVEIKIDAFIGSKAFFGSGYQHGAIDSRRKSRFNPMPFRQRFLLSGDSEGGSPKMRFITMKKLRFRYFMMPTRRAFATAWVRLTVSSFFVARLR
ncbi:hypothetical protein AT6N2_C1770 [Agrobacterium tumefaciens]|nr:hypothetical protein AT6N2_C1770 [Agrobacterium tumefaciens]